MTELWVADSGIRQLHARFAEAVWRHDSDALAACYTEDGENKIAGLHLRGREEIRTTFHKLLAACERIRLIVGATLLEVGDGEASGRTPITEFTKMGDGSSVLTIGVYYDRYVEQGGRWYYKWRHFGLHYRGPIDMSAPFVDSPDYGAPPQLPGADEPTFTRRAPV